MATVVNTPSNLISALRCVEYQLGIPSVGIAPEEIRLMYRLKNLTDNIYLTNWKYYKPTVDGEVKTIDFEKDLFGIIYAIVPPLTTSGIQTNTTAIKEIAVEYGSSVFNSETCETTDTPEGITDSSDVLNGIPRSYQKLSQVGTLLNTRIGRYTVSPNSKDWIYVIGSMEIAIDFYDSQYNPISGITHSIVQTHPGSSVKIIPCGFQIAPAGTRYINVFASTGVITANDLVFTVDGNFCADQEDSITDIYFQNNLGGNDLLSFQRVEGMGMTVAKEEIVNKFSCGLGDLLNYGKGQRLSVNNKSFPVIQFKRSYAHPISPNEARWLNELAASSNVWVRESVYISGVLTDVAVKFELSNNQVQTYGGSNEFVISGYYSEVYLFPY